MSERKPLFPLSKKKRKRMKEVLTSYLMILPAIVFLAVFTVYPVIHIIQLSLYKGNATNPYKKFVGLKNYETIFTVKREFPESMRNTAIYTAWIVILIVSISLLLALWMFKDRKINRFAQTAFFTPHLVASVSAAFVWSWLFSSEDYGLFNSIMKLFGQPSVNWLGGADTALACIIVMNTWKSVGYYAIILLSALKAIPPEIFEAARLDNASSGKTLRKLTIPMLSPQLFLMLITITIGSFKVFDSVRLMTGGGPGTTTTTISMFIQENAFQRNNALGIGSAAGVVLMVILVIVTLIYFRVIEKRVHYQ